MTNSSTINEDILELHRLRTEWFISKNLSSETMMSYLFEEFVGTMALQGYSEEFAEKTFKRMNEKFKTHHMRHARKDGHTES